MKIKRQPDIDEKIVSIKSKIQDLINRGQYDQAWEKLEKMQAAAINDADVYSMKSIILIAGNKLTEAEKLLVEGANSTSRNFDLLYNLGYIYEQQGKLAKAADIYLEAEKLASGKEETNDINAAVGRLREIPQAEMYIANARTMNAVDEIKQMVKERKYSQVIKTCEDYLQGNEPLGYIYYYLGVAYNALSDFAKSEEYHRKALTTDRKLADLREQKVLFKDVYDEAQICCIGCGCEDSDAVWVGNQSLAEIDKGLINPLRIWVRCRNCGLVYANPQPMKDTMDKYYSLYAQGMQGGLYGNIESLFEKKVQMSNNRLNIIKELNKGGKRLLDIGAGTGIFTGTAIDRGWNATGLELTGEDCQYARDNFGLELVRKDFYQLGDTGMYDVITMFEVIEHLYTPFKDLAKVNSMISNGGLLVVATPIVDSLYAKKMKERNPFWYVKTHLTYFPRSVLTDYLISAGFAVLDTRLSEEGMGRMEFYCRKVREASNELSVTR